MGKTERVILIKGDHKKWYNQAIFIINPDTPKAEMPTDLVAEAEKIIANYMTRKTSASQEAEPIPLPELAAIMQRVNASKKAKRLDFALNFIMTVACIAIVAIIVYGMMI